jgi:hypothetical protein
MHYKNLASYKIEDGVEKIYGTSQDVHVQYDEYTSKWEFHINNQFGFFEMSHSSLKSLLSMKIGTVTIFQILGLNLVLDSPIFIEEK